MMELRTACDILVVEHELVAPRPLEPEDLVLAPLVFDQHLIFDSGVQVAFDLVVVHALRFVFPPVVLAVVHHHLVPLFLDGEGRVGFVPDQEEERTSHCL